MGRVRIFAGIDVGGEKKGYHVGILLAGDDRIHSLFQASDPADVIGYLKALESTIGGKLAGVAIDSPLQESRRGEGVRSAEKELVRNGYRVFWTPRNRDQADPWMVRGARLSRMILEQFSGVDLVESFPTASSDGLFQQREVSLPLSLLAGSYRRKTLQDFFDACILARTAEEKFHRRTRIYGPDDESAPIHTLNVVKRIYTLCMVTDSNRILLGKKKRGFGQGKWNGFGGKLEPGETPGQGVRRELMEEAGIGLESVERAGIIRFTFDDDTVMFEGHVFQGKGILGTPVETEEMRPRFFEIDQIPYKQMWADDLYWLPALLEGRGILAHFHFNGEGRCLDHTLSLVERGSLGRIKGLL